MGGGGAEARRREPLRKTGVDAPEAKARATKEKARIERFYNLTERAADEDQDQDGRSGGVGQLHGRHHRRDRHGDTAFGDKKILGDFTYSFVKGDKIGLVGPNGG